MSTVAGDNRQGRSTALTYLTSQAINMALMRTDLAILQELPGALHSCSQLVALIKTEVSCYSPHCSSQDFFLPFQLQVRSKPLCTGRVTGIPFVFSSLPPSNGCSIHVGVGVSLRRSLAKPVNGKQHRFPGIFREGGARSPAVARGSPKATLTYGILLSRRRDAIDNRA